MSDTIGGLIDKLFTIDTKMWNSQEVLYEIRRLSYEQFKQKYFKEEEFKNLWICLQKTCDLNLQRNVLIDEIDEKIIEIIKEALLNKDLDSGKFVQRKHKTY